MNSVFFKPAFGGANAADMDLFVAILIRAGQLVREKYGVPALILYFLLGATGIPATEAQALRSRGSEYRAYQRTTSTFVPWFPKKDQPYVSELQKL